MKYKIILCWLVLLIYIIFMFAFSNMSGEHSNNFSVGILNRIKSIKNKVVDTNNTTSTGESEGIKKSKNNEMAILGIPNKFGNKMEFYNVVFRKIAHFFEYFFFSLIFLNALRVSGVGRKKSIILVMVIGIIYAFVDEFHQSFIPGRTPLLIDIFIDLFGIIILLFLINKNSYCIRRFRFTNS